MNRKIRYSSPISHKSRYVVLTSDIVIPMLIIALVVASLYFITSSNFFSIKNIECLINFRPCSDTHLLAELEKIKGQNIFTLNKQSLSARILQNNKIVSSVDITYELPNAISVRLNTSPPSVALKLIDNQNMWILLSEEFRTISLSSENPNVPTVLLEEIEGLAIGEKISDPSTISALKVALSIKGNYLPASSISLTGETITLELDGGRTALLSTRRGIPEQLITLRAILADETISETASIIDVRYTQPVIKSD